MFRNTRLGLQAVYTRDFCLSHDATFSLKKFQYYWKKKRMLTLDWEFVLVILLHTFGCSKVDRKSHLDPFKGPAR